jgi:hypothetical protein
MMNLLRKISNMSLTKIMIVSFILGTILYVLSIFFNMDMALFFILFLRQIVIVFNLATFNSYSIYVIWAGPTGIYLSTFIQILIIKKCANRILKSNGVTKNEKPINENSEDKNSDFFNTKKIEEKEAVQKVTGKKLKELEEDLFS